MVTTPQGTERPARPVYTPRKSSRSWKRSPYFRNPYAVRRRGPSPREILVFVVVMVVLLVADGVYVALSIQSPLRETARYLDEGAKDLQRGDVDGARRDFAHAVSASRDARSLSERPSLFLASHIPGLSRDADAIRALTLSASLFAIAGTEGADAVEVLEGTSRDEIANALYHEGRLQFDTIDEAQTALASASEHLREARRVLEEAPFPRIDRIASALETARDQVIQVEPRASAAARLLDAIPQMMGRDGPRTYFVALQAQSEARATGGLIGLYGLMEADRGRIGLTHVGPSYELGLDPKRPLETGILLPAWYAARYGDEISFENINRSPNFPLTAQTILQIYENATGRSLDGVWSFDPIAFQEATRATGPLRGSGWDVELGPDNAARVLLQDVYTHFGAESQSQTQFLIGIIQDLFHRLDSGEADTAQLLESLSDAAQGSHFKIYSRVPEEQRTLEDLGVDGGLDDDGPPSQMVFHNNLEGNKIDYFLRRTIRSTIRLDAEGGAEITTTAVLDNQAPSGPPSALLGYPHRGERPGFNDMELNFLMPRGASEPRGSLDGQAASLSLGQEGSLPLASIEVGIPSGETREVTITYTIHKVQRFLESARDFRFVLNPQPTAVPDRYVVQLIAPGGYGLLRGGLNSTAKPARTLVYKGDLAVPATIHAHVVRRS